MTTKFFLTNLKINFQEEIPIFTLTKLSKDINLSSDSFHLQTELRNTFNKSNTICQFTHVSVLCAEGVIDMPLSKLGCIGEVALIAGNKYISGKTNDLSGFGVDFSKPVKLTCETKDKKIQIVINGKAVFTIDFDQHIGKIAGIQFKFNGTGTVNKIELNESSS